MNSITSMTARKSDNSPIKSIFFRKRPSKDHTRPWKGYISPQDHQ